MVSEKICERLDSLIDELILDGGVEAASLASILLAAKESARTNELLSLSCHVWTATNDMRGREAQTPTHSPAPERCISAGPDDGSVSPRSTSF